MKSILDPKFRYVRSDKTDLKATFARIRKQIAAQQAQGRNPESATPMPLAPAVAAPIPMRRKHG